MFARLRSLVCRGILRAALVLGPFVAAGCATLPAPDAVTPEQRAAICRNLDRVDAELARLYSDATTNEEAELALAAFRGQVGEYRDAYDCN